MKRAYTLPASSSADLLVSPANPTFTLNTIPLSAREEHFGLIRRDPSRNSIPVAKLQKQEDRTMNMGGFCFYCHECSTTDWWTDWMLVAPSGLAIGLPCESSSVIMGCSILHREILYFKFWQKYFFNIENFLIWYTYKLCWGNFLHDQTSGRPLPTLVT